MKTSQHKMLINLVTPTVSFAERKFSMLRVIQS